MLCKSLLNTKSVTTINARTICSNADMISAYPSSSKVEASLLKLRSRRTRMVKAFACFHKKHACQKLRVKRNLSFLDIYKDQQTTPVNHKNNLDMSKAELELHQKTKLILQEIS